MATAETEIDWLAQGIDEEKIRPEMAHVLRRAMQNFHDKVADQFNDHPVYPTAETVMLRKLEEP